MKEVQQFLEKSIKKQTELFSLLGIGAQRWVYATLNSKIQYLNRGVQYPSRDQHESLSSEDIKQFQIEGVLYKNSSCFDFLFKNGLKTNSGCAPPMTEHLIKPAGAVIRSIDIQYWIFGGRNLLYGLRFKDKDANTLLQCGKFYATDN